MFSRSRPSRTEGILSQNAYDADVVKFQKWFQNHATLAGQPYTLDLDQTKAVLDLHKNTLVTARAGSGKTRVIVAKIAYLVIVQKYRLDEIAAFMFNRTAAAEVNQRIKDVCIDGKTLLELSGQTTGEIKVASTFHKYALDLLKSTGLHPEIITETEQNSLIANSVKHAAQKLNHKLTPNRYREYFKLASSFIARAGQRHFGAQGMAELGADLEKTWRKLSKTSGSSETQQLQQICFLAYQNYLKNLKAPKTNFNLLISHASTLMSKSTITHEFPQVRRLKYLLVDEYQDFSYLFFTMICAMRGLCPESKLFVVGDDWQAINRFAGSDVNYFTNFPNFFPEDNINIPLKTNYRSQKRIVEYANDYMLKNYDPKALRAIPFSKQSGHVKSLNYQKIKFDTTDLYEDALGDARYQLALISACQELSGINLKTQHHLSKLLPIAKMLKLIVKIIRKHTNEQIMLLHRHNFTSVSEITLEILHSALQKILVQQNIMSQAAAKNQLRNMTMHKSKGLESEVVILLEMNQDVIAAPHPHANLFEIFGDNPDNELADRHRLLYVALTRAKRNLYILSSDQDTIV